MYVRDTILTRKVQKKPEIVSGPTDPKTGKPTKIEIPYAYNRVRVIGPSNVKRVVRYNDGAVDYPGDGIIIQPHGECFGPTEDRTFAELQEDYNVEFIPEEEPVEEPVMPRKREAPLPTPEQAFTESAKGK